MKKPFKIAAWSGVISFVLSTFIFLYIFNTTDPGVGNVFTITSSLASGILGVFFLYGFVVLAKKFNGKLLLVMAWIGIAFAIVSIIFGLIANLTTIASAQDIVQEGTLGSDEAILLVLVIIWVVVTVILGAFSILFGIGLLKLKNKVQYAKVSGILEIISGATYIIAIGFLVRLVATIFEIAMMFKASERFEK